MRVMGHNALAIFVAALAIYLIGFVIYALLIPQDAYMAMANIDPVEAEAQGWKMALGPVPTILVAIGLSVLLKWKGAAGWRAGLTVGLIAAIFLMIGQRLYGYVYSTEGADLLMIDSAYAVLSGAVGGAILGAWR